MSKAFDTLDHEILIHKLKHYGICGNSLKLFKSYLSNRKQYTLIEDCTSDLLGVKTGVPQGSILGPFLFLIYINDISFVSSLFHPVVYADDTTLSATLNTFGGHSRDQAINLNIELNKVNDWLKLNKLSLNIKKTKAMVFHSNNKLVDPPEIKISNVEIEYVSEFNFLGLLLDKNLTWKPYINYLRKKLSKVTGIFNKLKHTVPRMTLITLYNSMFLPYLNYGLLVWGPCGDSLFKIQKRAVRIISLSKYNAHTDPIFKNLKLLKLKDLCALHELKFCYRLQNNLLPQYFQNSIFTKNSEIHNYGTRRNNNFQIPTFKHTFIKRTIRYRIPHSFNNMPTYIKEKIPTHSLQYFSKLLKTHYLETYNSNCTDRECYVCREN